MLKVVGASWLQTRISTYILVAVGLLGIGAIVLGEYGSIEKDGTYSATVFWNHKGGYRIDFWGQGNDLTALPRGAARAYYKTRIEETGWSIVEIETSAAYPDAVQAYAAGLLEGSLTWQLIHHHWYNTIGTVCASEENEERCTEIRRSLRENTAIIRERADLLASEDPFWHMVRLFYAQLDGMEAGWRFAVRRSRRSVDMDTEDFLWLAMASDLPVQLVTPETAFAASPISNELPEPPSRSNTNSGVIFLKSLDRSAEGLDPLIVLAQNVVAPYAKMLRLLKRYTFAYHLSGNRHAQRVPTHSIFMSSYPGALSSHDEYYVVRGRKADEDLLILAAIPLKDSTETKLRTAGGSEEENEQKVKAHNSAAQGVMSPVRIMAANRLATEARSWSRLLARGNPAEKSGRSSARRQWVSVRPKDATVWLIEQHAAMTHVADYTEEFAKSGFVFCHGDKILRETTEEKAEDERNTAADWDVAKFFHDNVTSVEDIRKLMRGNSGLADADNGDENTNGSATVNSFGRIESRVPYGMKPLGKFVFRADLKNSRQPVGVIDTKIAIAMADGLESFEATSGPPFGHELDNDLAVPFDWSQHFPNISHIGQPNKFAFDSVVPKWVWH